MSGSSFKRRNQFKRQKFCSYRFISLYRMRTLHDNLPCECDRITKQMLGFKFLFFLWVAFCFAKNRLFRVPASKRLHSFAALRNWLRQPLQSLPRFKIENLEFHLLETFLVFKTFEKSFGYLWRKMRGNYENP